MTEYEKAVYAKKCIDKLTDGINPFDGTPISEDDAINDPRVSDCLAYVSSVLDEKIWQENKKERAVTRIPFTISRERLLGFEYSKKQISVTQLTKRINALAYPPEIENMSRLSYRQIIKWLLDTGKLEWRPWGRKIKRFPTAEGERIGLILIMWENRGKQSPVVVFSESAQRFVIENMDAVIATKLPKKRGIKGYFENSDESDEAEDSEEE